MDSAERGGPAGPAPSPFATIPEAVEAIRRGEIVIVVDDPDREDEGDFVMAAERVTPEAVNFMIIHGRGLLCMPVTPERADRLGLRPMVPDAPAEGTAFTVSIDLADPPGNTGISAADRARCIRRAAAPDARPEEFRIPGHVFPIRARPGGVLERRGHTEAACDLARLAGLEPAGVICEIMNPDGTMARLPDLLRVARDHGLRVMRIADLVSYRLRTERHVDAVAEADLPTPVGVFRVRCYASRLDGRTHLALLYGEPEGAPEALVRLHSECLTGDVFSSLRCDCGAQLAEAMRRIAAEGRGAVVYLRGQEGRGVGFAHKLLAYRLQEGGVDTVEANARLGLPIDARDYAVGAQILADLGLASVRLLTNNPAKRAGLERAGVRVVERVPLETVPTPQNLRYLRAKRDRLGHDLDIERLGSAYA
jgi:3,4-dihydroxy 2-butanone 4-phosphate synthase/GTP cyclohydrolase II